MSQKINPSSFVSERIRVEQLRSRRSEVACLVLTFNPLFPIFPTGQLISATTEEIVKAYYPAYFLLSVAGQIQTRQVQGSYDDSYLGEEAHLSQIGLMKLYV